MFRTIRRFHLTLRWQLVLSYVPVILIPILITGLVVRGVAERSLNVLVNQEAKQRAVTVSGIFIQYYAVHNSWNGIEAVFKALHPAPYTSAAGKPLSAPPPVPASPGADSRRPVGTDPHDNGPILIVDVNGIVVAGEDSTAIGQPLPPEQLAQGAPLMINNVLIGTLVIGAPPDDMLSIEERQLLQAVSSALVITGVLTAIGVILLGLWLSGQLTAPVRDLMGGVKQLASGRWATPVAIRSQNELADLTRAFNHMAEELTRQQQQQRQMIADIAHDLRTPLSVMTLEVAGIRAGLQSPEEATSSLEEEIGWLQHLIDDLHTLSLMDTGRFDLHLDDTALTPYLRGVCTQWQAMAAQREKTLLCEIPDELPTIQIDSYRIKQILGNLLNNAMQHTPVGTRITLKATASIDQIGIQVIDNGQGIPAEEVSHLFERFYRADRARHRDSQHSPHGGHEQGSGLGLSIAYQLALLHHGMLSVHSQTGAGTTFDLSLPLEKSQKTKLG